MTAFQVGYNYQEYKTKRIMHNKISFKHSIEWRIFYTKARKLQEKSFDCFDSW